MGNGCKSACNWFNTLSCTKRSIFENKRISLVFGASRNTGTVAVHIGKKMGAKVITVSKNEWERDFGADCIVKDYDKVAEQVMILLKVK
jgi:NADPH:quinone reductase-like Zn-dependent oxidoreductase